MIAQLALLLPLIAGADAWGGSHYSPHRNKANQEVARRDAAPEADPWGGSHYSPHLNKPKGKRSDEVLLDERGMPITATTTVVVPLTTTNVVWVTDIPEADETDCDSSTMPEPTGTITSQMPSGTEAPSSASSGVSSTSVPSETSAVPSESSSVEPSSSTPSETSSAVPSSTLSPAPSSASASSSSDDESTSTSTKVWWTAPTSPWWSPDATTTGSSSAITASSAVTPSASSTSSSRTRTHHRTSTDQEPTGTSEPTAEPTDEPTTDVTTESTSSPTSTSSSSAAPTPTYTPSPNTGGTVMNGYWSDWTADVLPPESVDWTVYDVVNYAFVEPASDGTLTFGDESSKDLLRRLVSSAHAAGKRVEVSVGGWTGSAYFSDLVATSSSRKSFVSNIVDLYNQYNLDGIDLDWEYPGAMGAPGNAVAPADSANFLSFLKELRAALPSGALITAATQVWPFYDENGAPLKDVSDFAAIFDWILIMNYDIWGSSSTPGPNAPLSDGCKNSDQPTANAYSAVASWTAAGMPANKITLGIPAYGYVQQSSATHLYNRRSYPPAQKRQSITVQNSEGGTTSGQVTFESLVKQGALVSTGGQYIGGGGFTRNWDECSSTPWLKSTSSGQIITYDDPQSISLKGQFAKQAGLKGCSVWSLDGDYLGPGSWPLSKAARSGMGI